jgi:thiamine-phosphate pyrophosphorylase
LAALVGETPDQIDTQPMLSSDSSPNCSLYLITPILTVASARAFASKLARVLDAAPVACALLRMTPEAHADACEIVSPIFEACVAAGCALLIENDARLAVRIGLDGVHVSGAGGDLGDALKVLRPQRIVGAGSVRSRDEAMTVAEKGADYVMFGEPFGAARPIRLEMLAERVSWWAETIETPCVAYADAIAAVGVLADAGSDFVAVGDAIWAAPSPTRAAREAQALLLLAAKAS